MASPYEDSPPAYHEIADDGSRSRSRASAGANGDEEEEDEDEELPSNPLRSNRSSRPVNGAAEEDEEEGGEDLFGEDEDGVAGQPARRQLDDEELDSGDDIDRTDRVGDEVEQEFTTQEKMTMELEISRQPIPEPSDGEMYLLKVPEFMSIEAHAWDHKTFQPPTTDHHSNKPPSQTFSAYNTAMTTIRWRHSPSVPSQLQSNARINRWSDGSLTLQLASDPTIQYEIDGNPLAPPQRNPVKPTPTSMPTGQKAGRLGAAAEERYDPRKDAFTYLIRPHQESGSLVVSHKLTAGLSIKQSDSVEDDAIERLQASLAAAANASKVNGASGLSLVQIDQDPEKAKAEALAAVREREKAEKRRQTAIDREAARSNRVLGARGLASSRYSGLNVGMLEDDEMGESGQTQRSPNKARGKPRRRRNSEYSDDEDFGRRRFTKEDEYDEEDDFVAPSDEEEVVEDDDEDPDDGIVEEARHGGRERDRERTPKRAREEVKDDDEADAPGELEDDEDVLQQRTKRRRVVDEDEDDEA